MAHEEHHRSHRSGWLRAAVLGANDGLVSTASLLVGVASAHTAHEGVVLAGVAGLVAGAMAMAAGEYVSVSSQADTEKADLELEQKGLDEDHEAEREELAQIYVDRGLDHDLAMEVARQLMAHDALGAHARDEIGISEILTARPLQAAVASAASFVIGAAMPLTSAVLAPDAHLGPVVAGTSVVFLAILGAIAAQAGGAGIMKGAIRVLFWGTFAMAVTAGIGSLFGTPV